jgi:hypothetical protein
VKKAHMLGFKLGFWDYATFATLLAAALAVLLIFIWLAGLPGRIAIARKHPDVNGESQLCSEAQHP